LLSDPLITSLCLCLSPKDHKLTGAETKEMTVADPEVLSSKIDNLINLNDLNENAILHNLRIRFKVLILICMHFWMLLHPQKKNPEMLFGFISDDKHPPSAVVASFYI
jgi:hypothetical protein